MRISLLSAAVVGVLLLVGCTVSDPVVTPVPEPSSTPLFATDAEALQAATDAYAAYLKVSDEILGEGGAHPERLKAVATSSVFEQQLGGFRSFNEKGFHSVGATEFDSAKTQNYQPLLHAGEVIRIYVCADVSAVDVVDESGASVVTASRPDRTPFEVGFSWRPSLEGLVVSSKDAWTGTDFCN
jgi:hypothetical protein